MKELIHEISRVVDPKGLLTGDDVRTRAASTLDTSPNRAAALVRPKTTQELSAVMALCHKTGQAVVVQGGMTGLVGGAVARPNEIVVSLERMNEIESIDVAGRTITVGAGVPIQALQEAAAEHDLLFPVDWGARGSAMVGGAIATNAGGNCVLRYGMMRDQVLGLEAVLADGTVLTSMNRLMKNNTGYDLKQLFIGSEGTLGIVTRAVLRLRAAPSSAQTALIAVDDFEKIIALLGHVETNLSGALTAFEVMWREHYEMIVEQGGHQWALPAGSPYYVLIEATGNSQLEDAERFEAVLGETFEKEWIVDAVLSTSETQRDALWAIREDVDTFLRVLDPPIPFDVSVPIGDMEAYVAKVRADILAKFPHAKGTVFGHLGDGNLHFCWTVGSNAAEDRSAVSKIVYSNLVPYGGSVSAEHGIGLAKSPYLEFSRNAEEIAWMRRIKNLFDPKNILNSGRVIDVSDN